MKPIKVAFVNGAPLKKGGIETFMMNYFKNIDRSKIQIDFIVHGFEKGVYDEEILSHGGKIYTVPFLKDHPFTYFKKFKEVFNIAKPDIIHSHMNALNAVVLMIAKKNNIPIRISHSHSGNAFTLSGPKIFYHNIIKTFIPLFATELWACSKHASKWLYGDDVEPMIIYNAIEIDNFRYNDEVRDYYRRNIFCIQNELLIGHIGTLSEVKNIEFTIDVFSKLLKLKSDCKLLLIGDGPRKDQLIEKSKEMEILDNIIFLGVRNDVNNILQALDILMLPSHHEGLGVIAIEAQFASLQIYISENVPDECIISNNVKQMKLESGANKWAQDIFNSKIESRILTTSSNNYNIKIQAKKLENEYIRILDALN